ncbi:MAG: ATP-binding protein [Acidaminobacteraceae bacterium]
MKKLLTFAIVITLLISISISYSYNSDSRVGDEVIFVGVNNNYPYLFLNRDGRASGIVVDIVNEIASREGFTVDYNLVKPSRLIEEYKFLDADILFHGNYIEYNDLKLSDTIPFMSIRNNIYTMSDFDDILTLNPLHDFDKLTDIFKFKKIGIKNLSAHISKVSDYTKTGNLYKFDNYTDAIDALVTGDIDLLIMPNITGSKLLDERQYNSVLTNSNHLFLESYYLSTKVENKVFLSDINKNILIMRSEGFFTDVSDRWLSSKAIKTFDDRYLLYFNTTTISAILFIIYLIYRSNLLKTSVEKKDSQLKAQKSITDDLYQQLLEHEKFKNDYFINLSHELRTPLNVILGASQLIETYIHKENYAKLIENAQYHNSIIKNNGFRLLRVINNIIDINKFDIDEYKLNIDYVDIVYVIEQMVESTESYVNMKNLTLNFNTDIDEKIIECDPFEIDRVFMNLLSNAIKFSKDHGDITIELEDTEDTVVIHFKDNGIGISEENHIKIFERFSQVDTNLNRSHEGNGIGLSIVKSILDLHGGDIKLKSKVNFGSEFIITLPIKTSYHAERSNTILNDSLNKQYLIDLEFSELTQDKN